jgi:hypothetical protein
MLYIYVQNLNWCVKKRKREKTIISSTLINIKLVPKNFLGHKIVSVLHETR